VLRVPDGVLLRTREHLGRLRQLGISWQGDSFMSSTCGLSASALARPARCCMPPEALVRSDIRRQVGYVGRSDGATEKACSSVWKRSNNWALPTRRHLAIFTRPQVGCSLVWGYRYDAWSLRRLQRPKRYAVLLCFLQAALAETTDAVVAVQDKLITSVHSKAKKRRDDLLRASEKAKRRAVEVLEVVGELVVDETIPDAQLRNEILWRIPDEEMATLADGCHQLPPATTAHIWAWPPTGTPTRVSTRQP
jgi:hypothetical protein